MSKQPPPSSPISARTSQQVNSTAAPTDSIAENNQTTPIQEPPLLEETDSYLNMKKNRSFGRYELLMEMGQGGMATLYLARISGPEGFEKLLAIKKIHDHLSRKKQFVKMFLDEARIAARIQHPNVASIYEMGSIDGSYFIAMEYVHGQNFTELLRALVRQKSNLPWPYAARIVIDAAFGLHSAHELISPSGKPLNVVHRDVSPQNLLISYDGHVKVVDFGIAYAAERLVETKTGTLKGKAAYMSPEQAGAEKIDRRSDIFSLGIILYEAVCLKRLFREDTEAATLLKVRDAKVPPPSSIRSGIPTGLDAILMKALSKNPEDRYETAAKFAEALESLMVAEGQTVNPSRLSKLVQRVFYDRKKIKDQQIKHRLENKDNGTIQSAAMQPSTGTSFNPTPESSLVQPAANSKLLIGTIVGAATAVVVAIVGLTYFITGRTQLEVPQKEKPQHSLPVEKKATQNHKEPPRKNSVRENNSSQKQKVKVKVKVSVRPTSADTTIVFRGKNYKVPYLQVQVPKSNKLENITINAPGFHTETLVVTLDETQNFKINLRPNNSAAHRASQRRARGRSSRQHRHRRRPVRRRARPRLLIDDLK